MQSTSGMNDDPNDSSSSTERLDEHYSYLLESMLEYHPDQVPVTLKRMHSSQDPFRNTFLRVLPEVLKDATPSQLKTLVSTDMVYVLLEVLNETSFTEFDQPEDTAVLNATFGSLCLLLLHSAGQLPTSLIEPILQALVPLFIKLWKTASSDIDNGVYAFNWDRNGEGELRLILMKIVGFYIIMHYKCFRTAPPATSYVPHIALYCWAVFDPEDWTPRILDTLYPFSSPRDPPTSRRWFQEVCAIDAGFVPKAVKALVSCLKRPWLLGNDLEMFMEFCKAFIVFGRAMFHEEMLDNLRILVLTLGSAMRREMCCGKSGIGCQDENGRDCGPIARSVFTCVSFLFAIARPPNGLSWGVAGDTGDQILSTGPILIMMARQIPHAAMRGDDDFVSDMLKVLSIYAEVGESYKRSSFQAPPFVDFLATAREFAPRFFESHSKNTRTPLGDRAYNTWKKELIKLGLTMSEIRSMPKDSPSRHPWTATKPCQNRWCLCSDIKPAHPMEICKGCWVVFYCSPICQKADWESHKKVCKGRNGA